MISFVSFSLKAALKVSMLMFANVCLYIMTINILEHNLDLQKLLKSAFDHQLMKLQLTVNNTIIKGDYPFLLT